MASQGIGLASESQMSRIDDSTSTEKDGPLINFQASSSIAQDISGSSGFALNMSSPIIYQYLTFETLLPQPVANSEAETSPPPCPDLKKYLSPFLWSPARKSFIVWLSSIATVLTAYSAGSFSPPTPNMAAEWGVSEVAVLTGITTFCTGFAIAPMVLAPFSEINGRYPVFVGAGVLYVISQLCCALTTSFPGMLVARFWTGVGGSVFSTMVGGVISDLYHANERNTPMALFSGGALFGTGLGPLVSGYITQRINWRWVFWVQVMTCGLVVAAVIIFFRETRGSILLSRKARTLNKWYEERENVGHLGVYMEEDKKLGVQRIRWKVKSDEERESLMKMMSISVIRPFHLLFTEPVVFFFSLWVAFAWAVLYLTFGSVALVFRVSHGFTTEQTGAVFSAMMVGATLSTIFSVYQERFSDQLFASWSRKAAKAADDAGERASKHNPEQRLYFACFQSTLLPIGLFWFGWSQFSEIPWIVPTMAIGCATMGIYSIYLATFNYLADTYHRYASSALAAQSFCRNILGGVFPLVTTALFQGITFQGAASLLGGLAALLSAVPWILVYYGPLIRARSKFASEIM